MSTGSNEQAISPGIQALLDHVREHDAAWGFSNEPDDISFVHTALALCEEAGEVGGVVKKVVRSASSGWDEEVVMGFKPRLAEELVDLFIYAHKLMLLAGITGVDFLEAWRSKYKELHRRYDHAGHEQDRPGAG